MPYTVESAKRPPTCPAWIVARSVSRSSAAWPMIAQRESMGLTSTQGHATVTSMPKQAEKRPRVPQIDDRGGGGRQPSTSLGRIRGSRGSRPSAATPKEARQSADPERGSARLGGGRGPAAPARPPLRKGRRMTLRRRDSTAGRSTLESGSIGVSGDEQRRMPRRMTRSEYLPSRR